MILEPVRRTDEHHEEKHRSILSLPCKESRRVVFLGDSLTRRWEDSPLLWDEYFGDFSPANLGVGADRVENLLWRVRNGQIDGFASPLFLILAGTNNITENSAADIAETILAVAHTVRTAYPESGIVVFGLLPRASDDRGADCRRKIEAVNTMLREAASDHHAFYEYFGEALLSPEKTIDRTIMPDGLHLNDAGYRIAGPIIRGVIEKYIPPRNLEGKFPLPEL